MPARLRPRLDLTDDWQQLQLLSQLPRPPPDGADASGAPAGPLPRGAPQAAGPPRPRALPPAGVFGGGGQAGVVGRGGGGPRRGAGGAAGPAPRTQTGPPATQYLRD